MTFKPDYYRKRKLPDGSIALIPCIGEIPNKEIKIKRIKVGEENKFYKFSEILVKTKYGKTRNTKNREFH